MPTILDLAGLSAPDSVQGKSLVPLLFNQNKQKNFQSAFIETGPMIGIRTVRYLYGVQYDESTHKMNTDNAWFYDLVDDPFEQYNLTGTGVSHKVEELLLHQLRQWDQNTPWLSVPKHIPQF
jgi:arylsulfatase A-like enzyme